MSHREGSAQQSWHRKNRSSLLHITCSACTRRSCWLKGNRQCRDLGSHWPPGSLRRPGKTNCWSAVASCELRLLQQSMHRQPMHRLPPGSIDPHSIQRVPSPLQRRRHRLVVPALDLDQLILSKLQIDVQQRVGACNKKGWRGASSFAQSTTAAPAYMYPHSMETLNTGDHNAPPLVMPLPCPAPSAECPLPAPTWPLPAPMCPLATPVLTEPPEGRCCAAAAAAAPPASAPPGGPPGGCWGGRCPYSCCCGPPYWCGGTGGPMWLGWCC